MKMPLSEQPFSCCDNDLFEGLGGTKEGISVANVLETVQASGIRIQNDPRLTNVYKSLQQFNPTSPIPRKDFISAASDNLTLLHRIATREMAIADFPSFCRHLDHMKQQVEPETSGRNADYIPALRDAPSDRFGVAFCSVDGQFYESGHSRDQFSIQSISKPMTFALTLEKLGTEKTLAWCGIEPSGRPFNDMTLLPDNRPFNPMVNSGALMTAASLASAYPKLAQRDGPGENGTYAEELCNEILMPLWIRLSGNGIVGNIGFSEETFLSEHATADTNIGIAFNMKARKGLPIATNPNSMIDFYLRACSITANTASMSLVAATLANGGRNPITNDQVFSADVVKKTLSVMSFCGLYDNAGEFFFHTGMPSKSGVSGVVFLVLPNVGGFAFFSPRLDSYGNSVRGSAFAKKLVDLFTFHSFDNLSSLSFGCKLDPRFSCDYSAERSVSRIRWALKAGDKRAQAFDRLFISVCIRVAGIGGQVVEREVEELKKVYQSVMRKTLTQDYIKELKTEIPHHTGKQALDDLFELVRGKERVLQDVEKQLLIEATVKVTMSDGVIAQQERDILEVLSRALYVDPHVMDLHLNIWERNMKSSQGKFVQ